MRTQKHSAIESYLKDHFSNCQIEQNYDFDRGAQSFKIESVDGSRLLKVGNEFVDDNETSEMLRLFDLWALSAVLAKEKELGVLVLQSGLTSFSRDGV